MHARRPRVVCVLGTRILHPETLLEQAIYECEPFLYIFVLTSTKCQLPLVKKLRPTRSLSPHEMRFLAFPANNTARNMTTSQCSAFLTSRPPHPRIERHGRVRCSASASQQQDAAGPGQALAALRARHHRSAQPQYLDAISVHLSVEARLPSLRITGYLACFLTHMQICLGVKIFPSFSASAGRAGPARGR